MNPLFEAGLELQLKGSSEIVGKLKQLIDKNKEEKER